MTKVTLQILNRNYLLSCYYKELVQNNEVDSISKLNEHISTFDYFIFMSHSLLYLVKDLVYRWEFNGKKYMKEKLVNKISLSYIDKISKNTFDYFINIINNIDENLESIMISKMNDKENEKEEDAEKNNEKNIQDDKKNEILNKIREDEFQNKKRLEKEKNDKIKDIEKLILKKDSLEKVKTQSMKILKMVDEVHNKKRNRKIKNYKESDSSNSVSVEKNKIKKNEKIEIKESDSEIAISLEVSEREKSCSSSRQKENIRKPIKKTCNINDETNNEKTSMERQERRNVLTRKFNQVKNFENNNAVCMICFKKNPNQICSVCYNPVHIKCINSKVVSYVWVCDDCKNI